MNQAKKDAMTTASQFFQYRYPPFADTFEIQDPYQSQSEALVLQRASALIRQGKSLAIYGEAGTGKSMLLKSITNQLDAKAYRIATIPYGGLRPNAILRELCEAFDIDLTGRKSFLARLQKNFQPRPDKPFPIILVDDAHTMDNHSFLHLCSLLHDAKSRTAAAALILAGQIVLKKMLELDIFAPVRTRLACLCKLPCLTIEEAKEFIAFRLLAAQADQHIFQDQAIDCIAADSNGNRRLLMNLAAMCLEEAARRREKTISPEIVNAVSMENNL